MPRKFELTFQRGAEGRVGRWKKFYRGKAYYLGSGRGKSDVASYREAVAAWSALKVKLDAEIVRLPRARDAEYDEVIREWELVLSWSVQHGADEEAVVARNKPNGSWTMRQRLNPSSPLPLGEGLGVRVFRVRVFHQWASSSATTT